MKARPPKGSGPEVRASRLLDQADEAFDSQDFERALELAQQALAQAPDDLEALHYRAESLCALGRIDEAHAAYEAALRRAPEDLEVLLGAVELLVFELADERESLEDALDLCARGIRLARRRAERGLLAEFQRLAAMAHNQLGEASRALELLDAAGGSGEDADDAELGLERGIALWELCRFEEAREQLERVLRLSPEAPWAHHYLGVIAERAGNAAGAAPHFLAARRLCPDDFPEPVELSTKSFDQAVEDALDRLPARVRRYLENVTILVEDLPSDEDLLAASPPLSPGIVGLFHGTPITEKSTSDPWSHFPSAILLYQRNLQRFARSREDLLEQIGITLVHEVGHFLGLSEEDLYQRGLD